MIQTNLTIHFIKNTSVNDAFNYIYYLLSSYLIVISISLTTQMDQTQSIDEYYYNTYTGYKNGIFTSLGPEFAT